MESQGGKVAWLGPRNYDNLEPDAAKLIRQATDPEAVIVRNDADAVIKDDRLVTIEINNNAAYGYDVRAELVGERGSVDVNNVAYTRPDMALSNSTRFDADWHGRYAEACRR